MKAVVLASYCGILAVVGADDPELIRREVPWGETVRLKDFGGPDISLAVQGREMSYVSVVIADFTRLIPVARTNIQGVEVNNANATATVYGSSSVDLVPTRNSVRVEKKGGIPLAGSRSELYLLYAEPASGIKVYFLDEIAHQNTDLLVVSVLKAAKRPDLAPAPAKMPGEHSPNAEANLGVVSPELLKWYFSLQQERQALDVSKAESVKQFNAHAAAYHAALKRARAASGR